MLSKTLSLMFIAIGTGASTASATDAPSINSEITGRVVRVIDGDSFVIEGVSSEIRLWGLDAPEWNEAGGPEATAALTALANRRMVSCLRLYWDKHARIIARCTLQDGRDIVREMITMGVAREYCSFSQNYYETCSP